MGSLVMSQVVSDIGRPPPSSMFRGGSHQSAVSESSSRPQQESTSSAPYNSHSTPRPVPSRSTSSNTSQSDHATPVASTYNPPQDPPSSHGITSAPRPDTIPESERQSHDARGYDQAGFPLTSNPRGLSASSPSSPRLQPTWRSARSLGGSEATSPSRIKVRDLSHIQSMASQEMLAPRSGYNGGFLQEGKQYEISEMPVSEIIEMVAGLLTKITTTNDLQHEHLHRQIPHPDDTASMSHQTTSVLAFHGKNIPSITILSYLSRIHKYCPTTYEVFLSLLVYFDRMTETINKGYRHNLQRTNTSSSSSSSTNEADGTPLSPASESGDPTSPTLNEHQRNFHQFFVVDSFNIHRLVIAGVTCASKFFSDVFYTNSRYAKVGGLPLAELNHLELQFLLLNDFRLSVPVEELEAYGTMLVEFYAREIIAQQQAQQQMVSASYGREEGIYMRGPGPATQTPTPP